VHDGKNYEIQEQTTTLVIDSQDGELFTGYIRWAMDGGEEAAADDREPFIGVIGHDGEEITIAEVDDNGVWPRRDDDISPRYISQGAARGSQLELDLHSHRIGKL
jgi:hypothetical protein